MALYELIRLVVDRNTMMQQLFKTVAELKMERNEDIRHVRCFGDSVREQTEVVWFRGET